MQLISILVLSIVCTAGSGARIVKAKHTKSDKSEEHDVSEKPTGSSVVCSEFKGGAVVQMCGGVQSRDNLGTYPDRMACGEACQRAASAADQATCCVFTTLNTCVAYVGSDHVLDGKLKASVTGGGSAFRGSATVCQPIQRTGGVHDSEEFRKSGMIKQVLSLFGSTGTAPLSSGHGDALFRLIKPREIKQGSLGDCWLMAAIAAMARFPGAIRKLFLEQFRSANGEYSVRLYNPVKSRWYWITIDDSVPSSLFEDPMFAQLAADRAIWVLLLEKAVAKFMDPQENLEGTDRSTGYSKLIAGFTEVATTLLTGAQKLDLWSITDHVIMKAPQVDFTGKSLKQQFPAVSWNRGSVEQKETVVHEPSFLSWFSRSTTLHTNEYQRYTVDVAWEEFLRATKGNRLMTATIAKTSKGARETEEGDGLYGGHAYSILQAKEVSASHRACLETISVTYALQKDWNADAGFMKHVWWSPGGKKRFIGATWESSRAMRHGVEEGWMLVDTAAFDGPGPTDARVQRILFQGVVDDFECDEYQRHRSGRQTELVQMRLPTLRVGEKVRLLQVRNPWGNQERWTGKWSDTDTRTWTKHWDVADAVGFAPLPDGMWWMTLEDFLKRFSRWSIGGVDMLHFSPEARHTGNINCLDGFEPKFAWNESVGVAEGSCTPAHCNIIGTVGEGPHCRCIPGLGGEITWRGTIASGSCIADASALFNEGPEKLWYHKGMSIKCCGPDDGGPTRLQDMNSQELPSEKSGMTAMFADRKGCGYMFGDRYHNSMKKEQPSCPVSVTQLMEAAGESFETLKKILLK